MSELAIRGSRNRNRTGEPDLIRRHRPDYLILIFIVALLMLSVVVMYSIWPALVHTYGQMFVGRQVVYMILGLVAFFVASRVPLMWLEKLATFFLGSAVVASLLLTVLSWIPGTPMVACINGACGWYDFGFATFQPVEYVKFALLMYLGVFLAARRRDGTLQDFYRTLAPLGFVAMLIVVLIIVLQNDFGSGFILLSMLAVMAFVAGIRWKHLFIAGGAIVAAGAVTVLVQPYRMQRIMSYFGGSGATEASTYHSQQALIAIGSGGFFGKGLSGGVQAYGYLPEVVNDSIFAVIAEMFGFVGTVAVLLLFGGLIYRLLKLIEYSQRPEFQLIAAGVLAWVAVHTLVNVGAMLGVIPITGITLPFLSYGGSSLVMLMLAMGVAFSISRYTAHSTKAKEAAEHESRVRGRRLRGSRDSRAGRYQRA